MGDDRNTAKNRAKRLKVVALVVPIVVLAAVAGFLTMQYDVKAEAEPLTEAERRLAETYLTDSSGVLTKYTGSGGAVAIPASVGGVKITSIGYSAFDGCTGLTTLTIPDGVVRIDDFAFLACTGLTTLTIPDGVTSIGVGAFHGCTSLTTLTIPRSVTSIGDSAFRGCAGLTAMIIPDGVTGISEHAFDGCKGLTTLTIPGSVTGIGDYAFVGCTGLTTLTIPRSVTSIGAAAFYGCSRLTVRVPKGAVAGSHAFNFCDKVVRY